MKNISNTHSKVKSLQSEVPKAQMHKLTVLGLSLNASLNNLSLDIPLLALISGSNCDADLFHGIGQFLHIHVLQLFSR